MMILFYYSRIKKGESQGNNVKLELRCTNVVYYESLKRELKTRCLFIINGESESYRQNALLKPRKIPFFFSHEFFTCGRKETARRAGQQTPGRAGQ